MAILIKNRRKKPTVSTAQVKRIARIISDGLGYDRVELSLLLTDDDTIAALNHAWRGKVGPTDVLSFSQMEGAVAVQGHALHVLGDIVISLDTASRQASRFGVSLEEEVTRLMVHGMLHLLGHDHVHGGVQARRMKNEEARLLRLIKRRLREV
ncbi:MAG: rRNA maturation RNase YbeY [Myxococcota bacterium]